MIGTDVTHPVQWLPQGLSQHHCSSEILVESAWCRLNEAKDFSPGGLKKWHLWGTPLFLGVALLKGRVQPTGPPKVQAMLDNVRLEWSPPLATFMLQAML